jgi:hypothetical protein
MSTYALKLPVRRRGSVVHLGTGSEETDSVVYTMNLPWNIFLIIFCECPLYMIFVVNVLRIFCTPYSELLQCLLITVLLPRWQILYVQTVDQYFVPSSQHIMLRIELDGQFAISVPKQLVALALSRIHAVKLRTNNR